VELARTLGLDIIAEGVETEEQRQVLRALDCAHAQGYLFSRPEPAERAATHLPLPLPAG
jgi:EAL domain-containing protein (putative c-di-GMP-specific phosphodiesterase class I)